MTRIAIDQILQTISPARSAADSSNSTSSEGTQFQEHLQQATTSEKPSQTSKPQEDHAVEDDSDLVVATEQEQDPSSEQNDAAAPLGEIDETIEQLPEEASSTNVDDLVISTTAAIAAEAITTSTSSSTETEVENTVAVPATVAGVDSEADADTPSFADSKGDSASSEGIVDEIATSTSDEDPSANSDNPEKSNLPAALETSEQTIDEANDATKAQQNAQATQTVANEDASTEDVEQSSNQSLKTNGTSEKSAILDEAKPSEAATESTPRAKEEVTNEPPAFFETPDQELATASVDTESASVTNVASNETNTSTPANTNNESIQALGKSPDATPVEQSPATTEAPAEQDPVPTINRARFVQRVSGAFRVAKDQNGLVQLKLSPPELGTLRLEITVKQGTLTAQLETETAAARTILLDNLPALRERLAEQDIRIEKFDVDVREEGGQQHENQGTENRRSGNNTAGKASGRVTSRSNEQDMPSSPNITRQPDLTGGLDVMI